VNVADDGCPIQNGMRLLAWLNWNTLRIGWVKVLEIVAVHEPLEIRDGRAYWLCRHWVRRKDGLRRKELL